MTRSARLLALLEALRSRRHPVAGQVLADELGVSLRTIYRDVATLIGEGADIQGAPGLGLVLRPGFFLPPLGFDDDETDALILGLRLVSERGDPDLAGGAARALAKSVAALPAAKAQVADHSGLLAGPGGAATHLGPIRRAIRDEVKLVLRYSDRHGVGSERLVWPIAVGFFEGAEVLAAWCELRRGFRHFRLDRIGALETTAQAFPIRRRLLLADWRRSIAADGS